MEWNRIQWYSLILFAFIYLILMVFIPEKGSQSLETSKEVLITIAPFLAIVLILMIIIDYFLPPEKFIKNFGVDSGVKGFIMAMFLGLIIEGETILLYPMLRTLMKEDVRPGIIATFLYAKAISLPAIPVLVLYFGIEYTLILTGVMIIASVVIGILIEIPMQLSYSFYQQ